IRKNPNSIPIRYLKKGAVLDERESFDLMSIADLSIWIDVGVGDDDDEAMKAEQLLFLVSVSAFGTNMENHELKHN
ncbi:hypothetical protein RDWZM_003188, partial [Blomia tropicalis]